MMSEWCTSEWNTLTSALAAVDWLIHAVSEKDWVDYLSALLTPAIAIFAVLITYFQYGLEKRRRADDLFDRRFKVYESLIRWMQAVSKERGYTELLNDELALLFREGQFLYGKNFADLLREVDVEFRLIATWKKEGIDVPSDQWPEGTKEKLVASREYFSKGLPEKLYEVVAPYLKAGGIK